MRERKNSSLLLIVGIVVLVASIISVYFVLKDKPINGSNNSVLADVIKADTDNNAQKISVVDFKASDSAGNVVQFSAVGGKPIVLVFWASWSDSSVLQMDEMQGVYDQYKNQGIEFVAVNVTDGKKETFTTAEAFVAEKGCTFTVWYDIAGEGVGAYGIRSLPSTLFINGEGKIIAAVEGALSKSSLERGIASID